jgi:hypothetical protein
MPARTFEPSRSRARLMRRHAHALEACVAGIDPDARLPWLAALAGRRTRLQTLRHLPFDDCIDRGTGAQFFLHAHDEPAGGFAHVHCFVRLPGRRFGLARREVTTHLAAIALDDRGWPRRLLAPNQWVTGEYWQSAPRTPALLDRFAFTARGELADAGRAFGAMLQVFRPELRALLAARDARLERRLAQRPDRNVLDARDLEIVATRAVDLRRRLRALRRQPASAAARSAIRSSALSMPIEMRTRLSVTPLAAR